MTVFVAHAEADRPAAEALEKFLERRGLFVELETGERGFRIAQPMDTIVLLVSKDSVFSPYRLLMEKRALEAWADEQLVLVKLDHAFSPVGLRDLPSIDASIEPQRDIAWHVVAKQAMEAPQRRSVREEMARPGDALGGAAPQGPMVGAPAPASEAARKYSAAPRARAAAKRGAGGLMLVLAPLTALVVGAGIYAGINLRTPGVSGPALPRGLPPVTASLDLHLTPEQMEALLPVLGPLAALVLMAFVILVVVNRKPRAVRAPAPAAEPAPGGEPLFVSYSHADDTAVTKVVEAVVAQGRAVWSDKGGISAGEGWAGEIVRAMKGARGVLIMCSQRAFESDHVKREVYLADRYKKPMLPVFLEPAAMPEDFEYFFAGVQWLELHKTPESDRAAAIARALKAV